jgi:hypothetical protein
MHLEVLSKNQVDLLPLVESFKKEFYLVGGTAIALQLGHRESVDFDLFKKTSINITKIAKQITAHKLSFRLIHKDIDQFHIWINNVKLTFFEYGFHIPHPVWLKETISMPSLTDLGAMKAYALGRRAKWKDYVDLYWLLKTHCTLNNILIRAQELFGELFSEKLFRQQLCYFKDIDFSEEIKYVQNPVVQSTIECFLTDITLKL